MNLYKFKSFMFIISFFLLTVINLSADPGNNVTATTVQGTISKITVEGTAAVINGDQTTARNAAINDALKKAVEQEVSAILTSKAIIDNYNLLSNKIYSNTTSYIHNYKIISEGQSNNIYSVTVQVTVGTDHLKNDLSAIGLLMKQKRMPKVAVIILEQNIGKKRFESSLFYAPSMFYGGYVVREVSIVHETGDMSIAENEMMQKLLNSGFNVVDEATVLKDIKLHNALRIENLDDDTIKDIGKISNADVVIYGKALAMLYGKVEGSEMKSVQADVSLRAVDADDGRVLASGEQHASSVNIDEITAGNDAIKKATDKLADSMIAIIQNKWKREMNNGSIIQLTVNGIKTAGDIAALKDALMATSGVKDAYTRSMGNGSATVDVDYKGSASTLITSLLNNKTITTLYDITGTTMNTIEIGIK